MDNLTFVAQTIETTGLDERKDYIIEILATKVVNGNVVDRFRTFVHCPEKLENSITEITGITNNDLKDAPSITEAVKMFKDFCGDYKLYGYNTPFDKKFLCKHMDAEIMFDVLELAQNKLQGKINNFRIKTVCDYLGIEHDSHDESTVIARIALALLG